MFSSQFYRYSCDNGDKLSMTSVLLLFLLRSKVINYFLVFSTQKYLRNRIIPAG